MLTEKQLKNLKKKLFEIDIKGVLKDQYDVRRSIDTEEGIYIIITRDTGSSTTRSRKPRYSIRYTKLDKHIPDYKEIIQILDLIDVNGEYKNKYFCLYRKNKYDPYRWYKNKNLYKSISHERDFDNDKEKFFNDIIENKAPFVNKKDPMFMEGYGFSIDFSFIDKQKELLAQEMTIGNTKFPIDIVLFTIYAK